MCGEQLPELHKCAREGDVARVLALTTSGKLTNLRDPLLGFTALHFAAREGVLTTIRRLVHRHLHDGRYQSAPDLKFWGGWVSQVSLLVLRR